MAEISSAPQKCATVGVLKVEMPSRARGRCSPLTSVITTNIRPVRAAADDPVIT
jgi:hypothetical protein